MSTHIHITAMSINKKLPLILSLKEFSDVNTFKYL